MTSTSHPEKLQSFPIRLDPARIHHPNTTVSEYLYSGFLEHLGRCIYGGIVDDPKNPSPAELLDAQEGGRLGVRKDVKKLVARNGELEIPMMRWPGGNFVSNYHWQDGIGAIEKRPKRIELAWLSDESNIFGTDEFIDYCRATGCEPYICLNMGTGSYEEALAWVEYCNGTGDTHWANLRRKNTGRDEPHNVKYWGLGNEIWGPWQVGNASPTDYAKMAKVWAHGLKLVDPTIKLVSCGEQGNSDWDREVLQALIPYVDLHSIHFYSTLGHREWNAIKGFEYEKSVFGPAAAERSIEICQSLIDVANIRQSMQGIPPREVKICFDEWGVWDDEKGNSKNGLQQTYDYTDMLAMSAWLNLLVRKHKDIGIACLAQSVNVISPIHTSPTGILLQTTYYPLRLFAKYMKHGHVLDLPTSPDQYTGPTHPNWIEQIHLRPTYVDLVGMVVDNDGKTSIRLSILNRHPSVDWTTKLRFDGFELASAEVHEMYSDDLSAQNTWENAENVVPTVTQIGAGDWKEEWTVRKHSWCFFILGGKAVAS